MGITAEPIVTGHHERACFTDNEKAAILAELRTILESQFFRNSSRSKQFLSYVVQHKLEGREEFLKERTIGTEIFKRQAGYATGDDAVVRVQAGEVRRRLERYYHNSPNASPVHIELRLGSYSPEFRWNVVAAPPDAKSSRCSPKSLAAMDRGRDLSKFDFGRGARHKVAWAPERALGLGAVLVSDL